MLHDVRAAARNRQQFSALGGSVGEGVTMRGDDWRVFNEALPELLGEHAHTLDELARRLTWRTYRLWFRARRALLDAPDSALREETSRVAFLEPAEIVRRGATRAREVEGRRLLLHGRISQWICAAIASPVCRTMGSTAAGERVEIARELAGQLSVDLSNNTLTSRDGGLVWRAVTVACVAPVTVPASAVVPVTATPAPAVDEFQQRLAALTAELARRVASGEPRDRDAMLNWLAGEHPGLSKSAREKIYYASSDTLRRHRQGRPKGTDTV